MILQENVGSILISVYFRVGPSGTDQAIPPMRITPVPIAMQALSINGYGTGELLRVDKSTVTSAGIANNALSVAQYTEFWSLLNKTSTSYLPPTGEVASVSGNNKVTSLLGQALPAGAASNGQVLVSNGTAWVLQSMSAGWGGSVTGTAPIAVGGTATAPVISIPAATTSVNGYLTSADWNTFSSKQSSSLKSGKILVGNASGLASEVSLSGDATINNNGVMTLKNTGTAGTYGSASLVPVVTMDAGQVWYNSISNVIKYYDGTAVQSVGASGPGLTSLNGLTAGAQTFTMGSGGTAPAFTSGTSTHTLNIPMASTSSVTAGLISKTDYDNFNTKLSAVSDTASLTAGKVWVGNASNTAVEQTLSGDITGVSNPYRPSNYDKHFYGPVAVREALGSSLNVPAVKTVTIIGLHETYKVLQLRTILKAKCSSSDHKCKSNM